MLTKLVHIFGVSVALGTLSCSSSSTSPGETNHGGGASTSGSAGTGTGSGGNGAGGVVNGAAGTAGVVNGAAGTGNVGTGGVPNGTAGTGSAGGGGVVNGTAGTGSTGGGGVANGGAGSGGSGAGGKGGSAGSSGGGSGGGTTVNCSGTLPTGGTPHTSSNAQGMAAGLSWSIWTNSGPGTITTFSTPAFSASWGGSGDFLARIGLEWGNSGKTYDKFGTISAQFAETKTGTGGGYSYIGIYGWSTSPCVEYYIVDDSYNKMPVNPGNTTNKGTATIDGGTYNIYLRNTSGTGGSRCSGVSNWAQYYSIRQTARQCGQISITEHFNAWAAAGLALGNMLEAKILVETGGGTGSIEMTTANVTATAK